jgi:hypothetical protein
MEMLHILRLFACYYCFCLNVFEWCEISKSSYGQCGECDGGLMDSLKFKSLTLDCRQSGRSTDHYRKSFEVFKLRMSAKLLEVF